MKKLALKSYAKLNLYLDVRGKRKDNYHSLRTLFERIDIADQIVLKLRPDKKIKIHTDSPQITPGPGNLAYQAAKLLQEAGSIQQGAAIKITKRIPVGAGLGGGSGNAAAVLLGLNKLWGLGLSQSRLLTLANRIGSDVAFFIHQCPFAEGLSRGERVRPLSSLRRLRLWHVVIVPRILVSTPLVYKEWDRQFEITRLKRRGNQKNNPLTGLTMPESSVKILTSALRKKDFLKIGGLLYNSLERATFSLFPEVERIKEKLLALRAKRILMSGSGPAVFAVVSSRKEACALAWRLRKDNRSWRVYISRTV